MDASTRLYARLGEIPEDPNDPESLDDLIVCAFGAFERYYLCWKTKGGEFRQDGYDLPPALNEWLNPTDGTQRDWATLQVVFGRGEEYFASDKHGKLEFKEPDLKKTADEEEKGKSDRQALRRSRTVSFLRPLSQASIRSDGIGVDGIVLNRRTSSISSQRMSRPPSLSYSTAESEASLGQPGEDPIPGFVTTEQPSFLSRLTDLTLKNGPTTSKVSPLAPISATTSLAQNSSPPITQSLPSDIGTNQTSITSIPEERAEANTTKPDDRGACTCGCHALPSASIERPKYANASVQTDPVSPRSRVPMRVDTLTASRWGNSSSRAISFDAQTPVLYDSSFVAPFSMGRMTNYFSKPGYQLGDSLSGGYRYYEQPEYQYQYQDEFGEEALR